MKELLNDLFTSKKFVVLMGGVVSAVLAKVAGKYNMVLDPAIADDLTKAVCGLVAAYLVGQGVADFGKGATEAAAAKDPA